MTNVTTYAEAADSRENHGSTASRNEVPNDERSANTGHDWPLIAVIGFRWLVIYFGLYCTPFLIALIPFVGSPISEFWGRSDAILPWVGNAVFGLPNVQTDFVTGSGDTTADYLRSFVYAVIATIGTLIWSIMRRNVREYRHFARWFVSAVRYTLAGSLISYGVAKVVPMQFPTPSASRLVEPFGALSPMGLLWAFTGTSTPYQIFAGFTELIPGLLLIFRRTALVGAMMAVPVLVNVVLLNYTYDVPVKLYSSHLLAMSLIVMAPNAHRLWCVLIVNRPVAPADHAPPSAARWVLQFRPWVKGIFLVTVAFQLGQAIIRGPSRGVPPSTDPLHGAWDVQSFRTAATSHRPAWQVLAIGRRSTLRLSGDSVLLMDTMTDTTKHTLALYAVDSMFHRDSSTHVQLQYTLLGGRSAGSIAIRVADTLVLAGTHASDSVYATLVRRDVTRSRLLRRGFHWIQEYPYNR